MVIVGVWHSVYSLKPSNLKKKNQVTVAYLYNNFAVINYIPDGLEMIVTGINCIVFEH